MTAPHAGRLVADLRARGILVLGPDERRLLREILAPHVVVEHRDTWALILEEALDRVALRVESTRPKGDSNG